jgi:hypothetical protein
VSEVETVLMVGGPADGRWMVANDHQIIVADFPAMGLADLAADPLSRIDARQVRYAVQPFQVLGMRIRIAVAEGEFRSSKERDNALIRALFQRDVAEALGAYR